MNVYVNQDFVTIIKDNVHQGEYNIHELEFEFSEEYTEDLVKKVIFTPQPNVNYSATIIDNKATIPEEALRKTGDLLIGVYAYEVENEELKMRYSPAPTYLKITNGSYSASQTGTTMIPALTVEEYEQRLNEILTKFEFDAQKVIDEVDQIVDDAKKDLQEKIDAFTPLIPTKMSQLQNDSGYTTDDTNQLVNYELKAGVGHTIEMSIDSQTYVVTLNLKNSAGTTISTQTIDLPLEAMVVSGSYDDTTKKIILTLNNGQTVEFSVADLVSGLQSEITSNNKLSADLVDDTSTSNKFVTANEKTAIGTAEQTANKVTTIGDSPTDTQYPSALAVKSYVNTHGGSIDSISVNNVAQPIVNKNVNIEVPEITYSTTDLTPRSFST